ncbi:hypothetical protein BDN71DRAFT_1485287 [Pleurotus eryngii]|uniref:CxC2-like cysteine cluster KDZ transposase-associated domain-containing protein n=1 Tax=Pleurotus eryngii TaxID=5323 RepID=A0A9P5ZKS8_PLEER|nr:hypothetical protein BDN71DRAFT_1485287 [Pleurotus eryngii]
MRSEDGRLGGQLCFECTAEEGIYRCKDCLYAVLFCASCIVEKHKRSPFHRIQAWEDGFFTSSSLKKLGYVIPLGHDGHCCKGQPDVICDFVVINVSGIHITSMRFCSCRRSGVPNTRHDQLFRHKLFPTTLKLPRATFTFEVLDSFHLLMLQSKISVFDFYRALKQKTDNTGLKDLPDYYKRFLEVVRAWRDLMAAKCSGRGHDPEGLRATKCGQVAVECPACPHPAHNLPEDWENAPTSRRWLYSLILTMDANFRLKNRERVIKNDAQDAEWRAINQANQKRSASYASTSVGGVVCGRHGLVRRNGFGDLQKGERFVVLKFHLYGHGTDCQLQYLVNLLPGCAQSDLEDPECWWAHINPVSMSTKLMSPWSRRETIDDHARRWNWRKITQFGTSLSKGLDEAVRMKARHSALHSQFTESFPLDVIHIWEREVSKWEKDPLKPNPFSDNLRCK